MLNQIKNFVWLKLKNGKKLIFWLLIAVVLFGLIRSLVSLINFFQERRIITSFLTNLIAGKNIQLKNFEGRTNFLLLGIPGKEHDGIDLTDTMIFVSVDTQKNDILMLSIPRDIWLESLKDKINTAYHYGEEKKEGGGFVLAAASVEEVVGQLVHYVVMIDFEGFKQIIDLVGGIEVEVEEAFVDEKFPITGKENDLCGGDPEYKCRYETVRFEKGLTYMDGELALKFVRSRNAEGAEGTDFARGKRQQKVLEALLKKMLTFKNLSSGRISTIVSVLEKTVRTNLTLPEAFYLGRWVLSFKGEVRSISLDSGSQKEEKKGFLVNPAVEKYGKWVLIPRGGNFDEIHSFVSSFIKDPNCSPSP